jgi:hypothetical protein
MRREPLEEGRDGLVKGHCSFYSNAKDEKQPQILRLCWAHNLAGCAPNIAQDHRSISYIPPLPSRIPMP